MGRGWGNTLCHPLLHTRHCLLFKSSFSKQLVDVLEIPEEDCSLSRGSVGLSHCRGRLSV